MADVLKPDQRSKCMSAIRSVNTKPELLVRRIVYNLGYRYRLHVKDLPGKPDLVLRKIKAVIFVHGCFWHLHSCADGHIPESRLDYWLPKLSGNRKRDRAHVYKLKKEGWRVLTIWECQLKSPKQIRNRIDRFLAQAQNGLK